MAKFLYIFTAVCMTAVSVCAGELLTAARNGDIASQVRLAAEYFYGKTRKQNLPLAVYWFKKAADANSPQAQYNLALCLLNGWGCQKNGAAAFRYLEKSGNAGIIPAKILYAKLLFSGIPADFYDDRHLPEVLPDKDKAIEILRELAAKDVAEAQLLLAKFLFSDAMKHSDELRKLLSRYIANSSEPDPEAMVIYAACLRSGIGGHIPDPQAGAAMLEKAAGLKHPEAMAQLAEMYFNGFGVKTDRQKAISLYDEAIKLGSPRAMTDVGTLKLSGFGYKEDIAGAFALFSQAAEKKYPPALRKQGDCYAIGAGVTADPQKAVECYRMAAEAGDAQAAFRLGEYFRDGKIVSRNAEAAFYFFQLAARNGHPGGIRETGKALIEGRGVEVNHAQGMELLRHAAESGDSEAAALLR